MFVFCCCQIFPTEKKKHTKKTPKNGPSDMRPEGVKGTIFRFRAPPLGMTISSPANFGCWLNQPHLKNSESNWIIFSCKGKKDLKPSTWKFSSVFVFWRSICEFGVVANILCREVVTWNLTNRYPQKSRIFEKNYLSRSPSFCASIQSCLNWFTVESEGNFGGGM